MRESTDLERELGLAMEEFAARQPAPAYEASRFVAARPRRRRRAFALAACLAAATVGAGAVVLAGHGGTTPVAGPAASATSGPTPSGAASGAPDGPSPSLAARSRVLRLLVTSAERAQDPKTRAAVDLARVRALFPDEATFQRVWGVDGRGVSCGQRANGAASADDAHTTFFHGVTAFPQQATFRFSADRTHVLGVDCTDPAPPRIDHADDAVLGLLGGQITELATRGTDELGNCGATATTWFADQRDVRVDGTRRTWLVSLADGAPFPASAETARPWTVELGC